MGSLRNLTDARSNSATESFDLSYAGTLPTPRIPIFTTNPLRDALLGASGSQAAALRYGKWITSLVIAGNNNLNLDNLTSLSSTNIVGVRDSFTISNLSKLTNLSFPVLTSVGLTFSPLNGSMNSLTSVSFPNLASIGSSFLSAASTSINSLTSLSFPALVSVGGAFTFAGSTFSANSLSTISFPALVSVGGTFIFLTTAASLNLINTIQFPVLASIGGNFLVTQGSANSVTTISFPALVSTLGNFAPLSGASPALTAVNFSSLANIGGTVTLCSTSSNSITTITLPVLANVAGNFTIYNNFSAMNSFTTLLIGSTLKHINGNFNSGDVGLDRHNAWSASTYYPSYRSFTAPASAFSSTTTGTTCTVDIVNHGLQTGDIITVSGIIGTGVGAHNFNVSAVPVTRITADQFTYTINANTQIATGTATIQRQEVAVTPITKNGRKYICTIAGTSGASEPTWPTTIGNTVVDGTVTWTCSELSLSNILSRLDALDGTNGTITYGANRTIGIGPTNLLTINSISTSAGVATITTATNHGITTGTQVVISGCTSTALRYNGVWTATSTGLTTLTVPVPTDLNGIAGTGTMRLTASCPQFTGSTPIAAATIVGAAHDSHMFISNSQLRNSENGSLVPSFNTGIYNRNGTTNGFPKYSCTQNGWDIWYDTTKKRWINSPSLYTGVTAASADYLHTPQSISIASTSAANPAVIACSTGHGGAGAVFTVVIEGCSNAALNGSWTATATSPTSFTIPVDGSAGATTNSGTVSVLNQVFNQGRLMNSSATAPQQGIQQTITTSANHGFTTNDFIHVYGAVGTDAASTTDLNNNFNTKSVTSAITVIDPTTFRFVRYSHSQPVVGSCSLTTMPHMRNPSINDIAFYTTLKLRSKGLATFIAGTTGV